MTCRRSPLSRLSRGKANQQGHLVAVFALVAALLLSAAVVLLSGPATLAPGVQLEQEKAQARALVEQGQSLAMVINQAALDRRLDVSAITLDGNSATGALDGSVQWLPLNFAQPTACPTSVSLFGGSCATPVYGWYLTNFPLPYAGTDAADTVLVHPSVPLKLCQRIVALYQARTAVPNSAMAQGGWLSSHSQLTSAYSDYGLGDYAVGCVLPPDASLPLLFVRVQAR